MRSIARACGQGLLADRCPCGQFEDTGFKGNIDWQWGNCSVNLVYGRNLVRKISNPLNARRQNQLSPRSVLQILNNAAGELVRACLKLLLVHVVMRVDLLNFLSFYIVEIVMKEYNK